MGFRAKVVTYALILLAAIAACALVVEPPWLVGACIAAIVAMSCLTFAASPPGTGHVAEYALALVVFSTLVIVVARMVQPLLAR